MTSPATDLDGSSAPISYTVTGTPGLYLVTLPTTRAGFFNVTLLLNDVPCTGDSVFALNQSSGDYTYGVFSLQAQPTSRPLFVRAGALSAEQTTAVYRDSVVARRIEAFRIDARDRRGNPIIDPLDDVSAQLSLTLSFANGTAFVDPDPTAAPVVVYGPQPLINGQPLPFYTAVFNAPAKTNDSFYPTYFANISGVVSQISNSLPDPAERVFVVDPDVPVVNNTSFFLNTIQRAGQVVLGIQPIDKTGNPSYKGQWYARVTPQSYTPFAYPGRSGVDYFAPFFVPVVNRTYLSINETQTVPLGLNDGVRDPNRRKMDRIGVYTVELFFLNDTYVPVPGVSPANVTVLTSPPSIVSKVSPLPLSVGLGQKVTTFIQAFDDYGNQITTGGESDAIQVIIANKNDPTDFIPAGVTDFGDGNYAVSWIMSKSGTYRAIFRFSGVPREPIAEIQVTQSVVVGSLRTQFSTPLITQAGYAGSFLRIPAGSELQTTVLVPPSTDLAAFAETELNATLTYLLGETTITERIRFPARTPDGRQTLSIRPQNAVSYVLDIVSDGLSLPGSPYSLEVTPLEASFAAVEILPGTVIDRTVNASLVNATAGQEFEMYIMLRDVYDNMVRPNFLADIFVRFDPIDDAAGLPVFASLQYPPTAVGFVDHNNSAVRSVVVFTRAGSYRPQVLLHNRTLCTFPFEDAPSLCMPDVQVGPAATSFATSLLTGPLASGRVVAGVQSLLRLLPFDQFGNERFSTAVGISGNISAPLQNLNDTTFSFSVYGPLLNGDVSSSFDSFSVPNDAFTVF